MRSQSLLLLALCWACTSSAESQSPSQFAPAPAADRFAQSDDVLAPTADHEEASSFLTPAFSQAVSNAMWANPDVYPSIPVRIRQKSATAISVAWQGQSYSAQQIAPGDWLVSLPIGDVADGFYDIVATASDGSDSADATATLGIGRDGMRMTIWDEVGRTGTPRLHRGAGGLWATWTDRSDDGHSEAWLRQLDGAGRWMGDRIPIGGSEPETLDAVVALGHNSIAVLYQDLDGLPYRNFFQVVDFNGSVVHGPIKMDAPGMYGTRGGDITFDGEAFVMVWRQSLGGGKGELHWMRVVEEDLSTTGPVAIATAGEQNSFGLNSRVSVRVIDGVSMASFIRKSGDVLRTYFVYVNKNGQTMGTYVSGSSSQWSEEGAVFAADGSFLPVWSTVSLFAPGNNPPTRLHARRTTAQQSVGNGSMVVTAPMHRSEPTVIDHPRHFATWAWLDQRSKAAGPTSGKIQLYAATLSSSLSSTDPVVFDHAWFVEGTSKLGGVAIGENIMLNWLDERHGSGIFDPKPELYLETVWH